MCTAQRQRLASSDKGVVRSSEWESEMVGSPKTEGAKGIIRSRCSIFPFLLWGFNVVFVPPPLSKPPSLFSYTYSHSSQYVSRKLLP